MRVPSLPSSTSWDPPPCSFDSFTQSLIHSQNIMCRALLASLLFVCITARLNECVY